MFRKTDRCADRQEGSALFLFSPPLASWDELVAKPGPLDFRAGTLILTPPELHSLLLYYKDGLKQQVTKRKAWTILLETLA